MGNTVVRWARAEDEAAWRDLWGQYVRFYQAEVAESVTARTWARILAQAEGMIGRVAERDGRVVGFSVSIVHARSWSVEPACYLEDLFVDTAVRGSGAGRALIDDLLALGRDRGWARVYWHTRQSNAVARRLYDRFTPADDFVRYTVAIV
ncbi:MAG: GNAT family N-acetyltransferase [Hyphomicrobiaceae bacterium]|nr:GNAT family N-acetyltransferase [Hyphomicrobiaceae bacterium]